MPKISWPTVVVVVALCGAYVALEVTGHAIPSWLAGVSGTVIGGLFPAMLARRKEPTS